MSTLQQVEIIFRTNDDDKDRDTALTVELFGVGARLLARYFHDQSPDDYFPNNSTITKTMDVQGAVSEQDAANATLHINIRPNGHDSWKFDWHLNFTWSGNSPQDSQTFPHNELDQGHTDETWALNILPNP